MTILYFMYFQLRLPACGGSFPVTMANVLIFVVNVMVMMSAVIVQMKGAVEVVYYISCRLFA